MHFDAMIVGGSFAGLTAALYLARARRSVVIIDTGSPRNRFAASSHGFFAHDGSKPADMLATARSQVLSYPTVTLIQDKALSARHHGESFAVELATGSVIEGRNLILAFGISDELPGIPGLVEHWGTSVLHCPYCHGYEFSDQRLGVLKTSPLSFHQAMLISEWGPTTLYLNGEDGPDAETLIQLQQRGVAIEEAQIAAMQNHADRLCGIELVDGSVAGIDALYLAPRTHLNSDIAQRLGCGVSDGPHGLIVQADSQKLTTVPGVYAAGDITRGAHNVTWAVADGVTAGVAVHRSLIF